jgi:hypothetical protein
MDNTFLWFWAGALLATVLWWIVMLFRVAFIGPAELLAMFRILEREKVVGEWPYG